ncbi:hypothetical protein TYRP_019837 [Tyrophagus putrescentiae]|nr:hypothetical protein TYRP_019837 [Tyrophagus putrescentiae]
MISIISFSTLLYGVVVYLTYRLVHYFINLQKVYRKLASIPGPGPWEGTRLIFKYFLVQEPIGTKTNRFVGQLCDQYGDRRGVTKLAFGPLSPHLFVFEEKLAKKILAHPDFQNKADIYRFLGNVISGNGIFTCDGPTAKSYRLELRKHLFTRPLESYIAKFSANLAVLEDKIEQIVDSETNKGVLEDIKPTISALVLDQLGDSLFSVQFNAQKTGEPGFMLALEFIFQEINWIMIEQWKTTPNSLLLNNLLFLLHPTFWNLPKLLKSVAHFKLAVLSTVSKLYWRIYRRKNENQFDNQLLDKPSSMMEASKRRVDDFIEENIPLSEILTNKSVLKYLDAVIKESLRLAGAAAYLGQKGNGRCPTSDSSDKEEFITIPAGTNVSIMAQYMHYSERYYRNAKEFIPERWLPKADDENDKEEMDTTSCYFSFSAGNRACFGEKYALLQMKVTLVSICSKYDFTLAYPETICKPSHFLAQTPASFYLAYHNFSTTSKMTSTMTKSPQQTPADRCLPTAVQLDPASGALKVTDQLTKSSITTVELLGRNVFIIGAGKAVLGMATELLRKVEAFNSNNNNALQNQNQNHKKVIITISKGQLNIPHGSEVNDADRDLLNRNSITLCKAAKNNLPDDDSVAATRSILELIKEAKNSQLPNKSSKTPLILAFISGGGSALLALPRPPATLSDKQKVISGLVRAGADIVALNSVRGRLSKVKHGQLAELIISEGPEGQALELVTFIVSDIIGDPIDKIAMLQQFNVPVEDKIRQLLAVENTDSNKVQKVLNQNLLQNVLIGNNALAVAAAKKVINVQKFLPEKKSFKVVVQGSAVCGEVKEVVAKFITDLEDQGKETQKEGLFAGVCLLAGGETTVDMKDAKKIGLGGRCQEMGLLFLQHLISHSETSSVFRQITVLFGGTDGQDGPTSAAGVVLSWPEDTAAILNNSKVQDALQDAIRRHDSHNFFKQHLPQENCLLETGPSGTNVMDFLSIHDFEKNF